VRFSLRWLLGIVAFVAVACLSLIYASETISKALGAVLFVFLMIATLGAIFSGPHRRRFWAGCAMVGSIYIATAYLPPNDIQLPQPTTGEILDGLHQKLIRNIERAATARGRIIRASDLPPSEAFHAAGQSLAAFVWSIGGGMVATWFSREK
jgi:hypothetical protein